MRRLRIDVALNLKNQRDIRDLLPKLNQLDTDLISSVLATHDSGVRVLLAPPPDALEYPPTLPQVQQVTAWLKRMFPWVLVDLGLPLDEAAYAFLDGADRVIMSVLPDMVGMRNTKFMLAQFDLRNYPAGKVWPLLNREGLPGGVKKPDVGAYLGARPDVRDPERPGAGDRDGQPGRADGGVAPPAPGVAGVSQAGRAAVGRPQAGASGCGCAGWRGAAMAGATLAGAAVASRPGR